MIVHASLIGSRSSSSSNLIEWTSHACTHCTHTSTPCPRSVRYDVKLKRVSLGSCPSCIITRLTECDSEAARTIDLSDRDLNQVWKNPLEAFGAVIGGIRPGNVPDLAGDVDWPPKADGGVRGPFVVFKSHPKVHCVKHRRGAKGPTNFAVVAIPDASETVERVIVPACELCLMRQTIDECGVKGIELRRVEGETGRELDVALKQKRGAGDTYQTRPDGNDTTGQHDEPRASKRPRPEPSRPTGMPPPSSVQVANELGEARASAQPGSQSIPLETQHLAGSTPSNQAPTGHQKNLPASSPAAARTSAQVAKPNQHVAAVQPAPYAPLRTSATPSTSHDQAAASLSPHTGPIPKPADHNPPAATDEKATTTHARASTGAIDPKLLTSMFGTASLTAAQLDLYRAFKATIEEERNARQSNASSRLEIARLRHRLEQRDADAAAASERSIHDQATLLACQNELKLAQSALADQKGREEGLRTSLQSQQTALRNIENELADVRARLEEARTRETKAERELVEASNGFAVELELARIKAEQLRLQLNEAREDLEHRRDAREVPETGGQEEAASCYS